MKSKSKRVLELLRACESRNMLWIEPDGSWPIFWERAKGTRVWDAEGREYIDLTAAFGVAAAGHANPRVVAAGQRQLRILPHAMGDVHPHARKAELARELSRLTFERWSGGRFSGKSIFTNSGFEAVEAALKTALLATGGEALWLSPAAIMDLVMARSTPPIARFFARRSNRNWESLAVSRRFPNTMTIYLLCAQGSIKSWRAKHCGAVVVEPIQARGGINIPPPDFLPLLRALCDQHGALLILDEIYTGFGRTGHWFACEQSGAMPDLICLGKALTGGFPLSACVGRADLMDAAWPPSTGEAIHTSTFQGNPVGCAMALAQIAEIRSRKLPERAAATGRISCLTCCARKSRARAFKLEVRGRGLMAGLEILNGDGLGAPCASNRCCGEDSSSCRKARSGTSSVSLRR